MEWIHMISQSLCFMEENLENNISVEDITNHVFTSSSHYQRIFTLVTGYSIGSSNS